MPFIDYCNLPAPMWCVYRRLHAFVMLGQLSSSAVDTLADLGSPWAVAELARREALS